MAGQAIPIFNFGFSKLLIEDNHQIHTACLATYPATYPATCRCLTAVHSQTRQVETVGDCYVVAGGLIQQDVDGFNCVVQANTSAHALSVFGFAKALVLDAQQV